MRVSVFLITSVTRNLAFYTFFIFVYYALNILADIRIVLATFFLHIGILFLVILEVRESIVGFCIIMFLRPHLEDWAFSNYLANISRVYPSVGSTGFSVWKAFFFLWFDGTKGGKRDITFEVHIYY
jgi:hypothetical protein